MAVEKPADATLGSNNQTDQAGQYGYTGQTGQAGQSNIAAPTQAAATQPAATQPAPTQPTVVQPAVTQADPTQVKQTVQSQAAAPIAPASSEVPILPAKPPVVSYNGGVVPLPQGIISRLFFS